MDAEPGRSSWTEVAVRVLVRSLACGLSLACSLFALDMLARGSVAVGLAAHGMASMVVALAVAAAEGCARQERLRRFACAFALAAGLPGVGPIGVLLVLLPNWLGARAGECVETVCVEIPRAAHGGEARARCASRVELLLSQRAVSSRSAVRALRRSLRAPEEEVRLLAHALLERYESRVRAAIASALRELAAVDERNARFQLLRQLANLHWSLVERELVPPELTAETLQRAAQFACDASALRPTDELRALSARIARLARHATPDALRRNLLERERESEGTV